ncbi:MAG: Tol-Pal system beta propeller repeat protein TolB [Gammaproteobacteria bacterium]|nr:Tol-Pal system beta propeller repeat protein TolB [Gammaproteobacteria bacterium]
MRVFIKEFVLTGFCLLLSCHAHAVLRIEITQGLSTAQPIAIVPFGWEEEEGLPLDVSEVIAADLVRSGRFKAFPREDMLEFPVDGNTINFKNWRVVGVDNVVVGKLIKTTTGYNIQFQLFDVYRGQQLLGYNIPVGERRLRRGAHQASDLIYEKLTGIQGAFTTRIAYITAQRESDETAYSLYIADADGENQQRIVRSPQPLMSPVWSPDGRRLAYVSFENQRSEIYVQELFTGERKRVSGRPGINGAPAFSPDGEKLALTLSSEEGNPDIYVMDLRSESLKRLTRNPAIDTEPFWAPDGERIVFTSDRGGGPQIYEVSATGGRAKRLTFEGSYNARPVFSPDGKLIAMVHQGRGGYHIAVLDLQTQALRVLTDGRLDESPSFSPNGTMIIYATEHQGRGVLAGVSVDGRVKQRLGLQQGDVREPTWSPRPDDR